MNLGFSMQQVQIQRRKCHLCKQVIDEERIKKTLLYIAVFGAVAYSWCPACGQEVSRKLMHSEKWHKKVDGYIERKQKDGRMIERA